VAWFWSCLLGLRFQAIGSHSSGNNVIYSVSRLCVWKGLLTCYITVRGASKSINNLFNNLRIALFATDWRRLLAVLDVHRLETSVLAELRIDIALIWVNFGVYVALIRFRRHGLVATIACELHYLWFRLFGVQKVIRNHRIIARGPFKTYTWTRLWLAARWSKERALRMILNSTCLLNPWRVVLPGIQIVGFIRNSLWLISVWFRPWTGRSRFDVLLVLVLLTLWILD